MAESIASVSFPKKETQDEVFDVTIDMIGAGADLYRNFDPAEEEPEILVAAILFTARDMWRGR